MNEYLKNPNYDVCYYRIKSEFIQTFNLNKSEILDYFIKNNIYKFFIKNISKNVNSINTQNIIKKYKSQIKQIYSIYLGVIIEAENYKEIPFNFTNYEQKTFSDVIKLINIQINKKDDNYQIYNIFKDKNIEAIIIYFLKTSDNNCIRYLDNLSKVKLNINGKDLINMGLKEGREFKIIFEEVLKIKLDNPKITRNEEIEIAKKIVTKL